MTAWTCTAALSARNGKPLHGRVLLLLVMGALGLCAAPVAAAPHGATRVIEAQRVSLSVAPHATASAWAVEERLPEGLSPHEINLDGQWDSARRVLKWGPFHDAEARTLGYRVTGADGLYVLAGVASVDGIDWPVDGDARLGIGDATLSAATRAVSGAAITIAVEPHASVSAYAVEEHLPEGLAPETIGADGQWDPDARKLKWGPFHDAGERTFDYTVAGADGLYTLAGVASFDGIDLPVDGDALLPLGDAAASTATRTVSGAAVTIDVEPHANVNAYAVEERLPDGLAPETIGEAGHWDAATRKVKWGPFYDADARTLAYAVTGVNGVYALAGAASFDGVNVPITGDSRLLFDEAAPPPEGEGEDEGEPEGEPPPEGEGEGEDEGEPPPVIVPDVVGMIEAEARAALAEAGLAVGATRQERSARPEGEVLRQTPAAGTTVLPNTAVSLVVSCGARPARPDGFQASSISDGARLRWLANTEEHLTSYRVERRAAGEGAYEAIATVSPNATRYDDKDVTLDQHYDYRLYALAGDAESDYAGPASATAGAVQLRLGEMDLVAGTTGMTGLSVSDISGVAITEFTVAFRFDPDVVASIAMHTTAISRGLAPVPEIDPDGKVTLTIAFDTPTRLIGEGRLFHLELGIRDDADKYACSPLSFEPAETRIVLSDGREASLLFTDGLVCVSDVCGGPGDVYHDGVVDDNDVDKMLEIAVRKLPAEPCDWKSGDMNSDARLDSADVVLIMRMIAGDSLSPDEADELLGDLDLDAVALYLIEREAAPGETVELSLYIENGRGLAGLDLTLSFPTAAAGLTLEDHRPGRLVSGFAHQSQPGDGYLHLSLASRAPLPSAKNDVAELLSLRFQVADDAAPGVRFPINLAGARLAGAFGEDFAWYTDVTLRNGAIEVVALPDEGEGDPEAEGEGEGEPDDDDDADDRCCAGCGCRDREDMKALLGDWLLIGLALLALTATRRGHRHE